MAMMWRRSVFSGPSLFRLFAGQHKVYVGNLPFTATQDDVKNHFKSIGVEEVQMPLGFNGRGKGYAFVTLKDEASYKKAIERSGSNIGDRTITVAKHEERERQSNRSERSDSSSYQRRPKKEFVELSPQEAKESRVVYLGNLDFKVTENEIRTHFKGKGNIESIRIGTRPDGRSKGYSHITFATAADADKALTLNSSELAGRQVVVKKAAERTQSE